MLDVNNLHVSVEGKQILKGFSLRVRPGEIHAIMGPNGSGKSTLAKVLAGHPHYQVNQGDIHFLGEDLLALKPEARANRGLFVGFQYPIEVPGVTNLKFLHAIHTASCQYQKKQPKGEEELLAFLRPKMEKIKIPASFIKRELNSGLSGGEKKRNELLQMLTLDPALPVLDETDSGLDIDTLRLVAESIEEQMSPQKGLIVITHYQRLLNHLPPHFVHLVIDGRVVQTGDADLAIKLEEKGYRWAL